MQNILKSDLQKNILKHIILTEQPDYYTISDELNRDRLTIRQSIESLSKIQCVVNEPINPNNKKSKIIFRPTIKGLVIGIGFLDIKFDQIKNNAKKITNLETYQEFKQNMGIEQFNAYLKEFSIALIRYDLINNNLNQIFSNSYTFVTILIRILLLGRLLNKDIDTENLFLFYENEDYYKQNVKDVVPPQMQKLVKSVLVKIRDNLQKTIDLLPDNF
jgi:hypothetical protein